MGGRVRIRIHCRRCSDLVVLLALALFTAASLVVLFLSDGRADASPPGEPQQLSVSPRRYYLTGAWVAADDALTACATGYHTAALWEIIDTTNLEYDSTSGVTVSDSGSGPPTSYYGWVRTGYAGSTSTTPGKGNCDVWTSTDASDYGTIVRLPSDWTTAAEQSAPWEATYTSCNASGIRVWCVDDNVIGGENYLPNVLKSY